MVATIGNERFNERAAAKTYFPDGYSMSLAMRRARAQYFWRNVRGMIGATIFGGSIYWYSIAAVSQDDFSDLTALIPSEEERASIASIEDLSAARAARKAGVPVPGSPTTLASDPAAAAAAATARAPAAGGAFGLGPKTMYYWPAGGLVQGAPSLALGGAGAPAVDWSAGKRV